MKVVSRKSMTLVEALIVLLLTSFVMAGLYTTLLVGNRSWLIYSDSVLLKQDVRRALFVLANDLREAKNIQVQSYATDSLELKFYRPTQGNIVYRWQNTGEQAYRLIREQNQQTRIVAQNITVITIAKDPNEITIILTAQKKSLTGQEIKVQMQQKIALRFQTPIFR